MWKRVSVDLLRLDVLAHEAAEPVDDVEALLPRRVPPRQLQHVLDDLAHAHAVLLDDLGQVPVLGRQARRLAQQLAGVAHRADGIADLVRDARAQPSERGELRLLRAFGDDAGVLEEHEHGPAAGLRQRDEVRPDGRAAVGADDLAVDVATVGGLPAPGIEQEGEPRRDQRERRAGQDRRAPQQPGGGLVDQPDAVELVDDEDALAQVLHDELVQLVQVRDVDVALLDERLALAQPGRVRDREQRDREQARAGEPGDQEIRGQARRPAGTRWSSPSSSASVMIAVPSSAYRRSTIVAVAPAGSTSSVPRPLEMPPLEWISIAIAIASTRELDHRLPGGRRGAPRDRLDAEQREREIADGERRGTGPGWWLPTLRVGASKKNTSSSSIGSSSRYTFSSESTRQGSSASTGCRPADGHAGLQCVHHGRGL